MNKTIIRSAAIALLGAVLTFGWNASVRADDNDAAWNGIKDATFGDRPILDGAG
jgi:hypothetical protein